MGKTVEMKRKKKGRPSLLDLQKRSLRLQQQQQQQQKRNPNPNPYLRFPSTGACCRSTRRNPISDPLAELQDDGEEEEGNIGKQREKKLKLVLRIHDQSENSPQHSGLSGSESEGEGSGSRRKRKIDAFNVDGARTKANMPSSMKATESLRAEISNSGPTTPLPDKKLLLFILDMLQKKDTYGVFSEPVDPEELPDYHEVIEHPIDFRAIRNKLCGGAYKNLEQFEKDVFLISSNAMRYNAPDTIYHRQARSIEDLAKKNFENLRQESDKEPETKTVVRRGRPPSKNINRPVGLLQTELTSSGFSSNPSLANTGLVTNLSYQSPPLSKKGSAMDMNKVVYNLRNSDSFGWVNMNNVDAGKELSGYAKGITTRFGKKAPVMEENRRNNDSQLGTYNYGYDVPIWSLFDAEKKQLAAVGGLHMEYAYARSLARFGAHLGSIGWAIAAKKIEKALPHGTKFGRGWVGENEAPPHSQSKIQPSSSSPSDPPSQPLLSACTKILKGNSKPSSSCSDMPCQVIGKSTAVVSDHRRENGVAGNETAIQPKTLKPNGFGLWFQDQGGDMMRPSMAPDMSSRNSSLIQTHSQWRGFSMQGKLESLSPDLNYRFESNGSSPASGVVVDSQQPDLALQL